jgi:hypothetical protein
MSETSTSAMLVGTPDMFAVRSNALTATIPRDQIEEALTLEPPAELILDVVRGAGREDAEKRTVNVAWSQRDLESLLGLPGTEAVTFYFDPAELERLFEDVEGHGLRQTAVVLSIAAAAAVGAGQAAAQPDPGGAGPAVAAVAHDEATLTERGIGVQAIASTHDEASLTERGIEPGTPAAIHDEATLVSRGIVDVPASSIHDEATLASRGIEPGTPPTIHDEATLASRGIEPGTPPPVHDEATLVARGIVDVPSSSIHDEATLASRGIEPGTLPAIHDEASLVARGIVEEPVVVDTGSGGFEVPSVDSGTAAATGALLGAGLLIVAAAFATRRREVRLP